MTTQRFRRNCVACLATPKRLGGTECMLICVTAPDGRRYEFSEDTPLAQVVSELLEQGAIDDSTGFTIDIECQAEPRATIRRPYVEDRRWGAPWPGANFQHDKVAL
ncbi:MAG: hypothetical protein K2X93_25945 [Candidatus Obscuribacterales bacterium]|nr:hypothetical protein [Candidatus Obscuribacterales bacterium]